MREFGVQLDFNLNLIVVGGTAVEALLPEEEATLLKGHGTYWKGTGDGQGH